MFSFTVGDEATAIIQSGIEELKNRTNIQLMPRTTEVDYALIRREPGGKCSSFIGRQGGGQIVSLEGTECGRGDQSFPDNLVVTSFLIFRRVLPEIYCYPWVVTCLRNEPRTSTTRSGYLRWDQLWQHRAKWVSLRRLIISTIQSSHVHKWQLPYIIGWLCPIYQSTHVTINIRHRWEICG